MNTAMPFNRLGISFLLVFVFMGICAQKGSKEAKHQSFPEIISLAGDWQFQLDSSDRGRADKWYSQTLTDSISLPGTSDEHKKGRENRKSEIKSLTRVFPYLGAAWYQREIVIPERWSGKHVFFVMERTKTSSVWVDGRFAGSQNSLSTEHSFELGKFLTPGKHLLSVCINNADLPPVGDPHQLSEHTQTNWNGIVGRIELQVKDDVFMKDVQAFPDVEAKRINLRIRFNAACEGKLLVSADAENTALAHHVAYESDHAKIAGDDYFETSIYLGDSMQVWDEFTPVLYRLKIDFNGKYRKSVVHDSEELCIGMRDFKTQDGQFQVNGKTIFLRGKHDACVFPLTGYAPMETEEWLRIFRIAKSYGINHYRYHTWCPPRAAFEAADRLGIYMQPELPLWEDLGIKTSDMRGDVEIRTGDPNGEERITYVTEEGKRILKEYGNHASFCMFALGNELNGDRELMESMVENFRKSDSRHLYSIGSNNFFWQPRLSAGDDYWTTMMTGGQYRAGNFFPSSRGLEVRASFAVHTVGHINNQYPNTMKDYSGAIQGIQVPVIGHEIGQFQVYPNFHEIEKYTGVVQARNFEIFKGHLKAAGMLNQADDFVKASGALAVLCYREDMETALRTPGFGGFQLLDLQDFPGQGTALVGILDAFMESKGLITPQEWRNFCNDVVPLARLEKYTWTNAEEFSARLQVANYSNQNYTDSPLHWQLVDQSGHTIESGELNKDADLHANPSSYGTISLDLKTIRSPQKLLLKLSLKGTGYQNSYPVWLYPEKVDTEAPREVSIAKSLDEDVFSKLQNGEKVLLLAKNSSVKQAIPGAFQSDFWCYPMFKKYNPPGTLGILCNPEHPALKEFPTEFHSNWQWWPLLRNGCAMILDDTPKGFRPIVQVIDNFERNHKLGVLFECRVGTGKLLVCSCDIQAQQNYPEARQLLSSLLHYMESEAFNPGWALETEFLKSLLW